jgi:glucose-1-phosphate thymidylyltransferase
MQAFILAGGFATRLWPLTEKRAKPLLPLAGKPILSHLLEKIPAGIPVTISTNTALRDGFQEWLQSVARRNITIVTEHTHRDEEKLGALGALAQWVLQQRVSDDLLLLTGDNYCGFSLEKFIAAARPGVPTLAAHDSGDLGRARFFGTVLLKRDGRTVDAFEEKPGEPKTTLVSTGCSILPAATLPTLVAFAREHPDNVGGIFEEFLRHGVIVECIAFREPWFDIGSFETYLEATRALVGERVILEEETSCEGTLCEGSVVIGRRSHIQRSSLRNVVVFEDCLIDDCILENCIIDNACILAGVDLSGKMLRTSTMLRASVHSFQ